MEGRKREREGRRGGEREREVIKGKRQLGLKMDR